MGLEAAVRAVCAGTAGAYTVDADGNPAPTPAGIEPSMDGFMWSVTTTRPPGTEQVIRRPRSRCGAAGIAEGSMAMPKSYPFTSNIRVLTEGGVAEYGFTAAPADDGGNIGESQSKSGLRLYPTSSHPQVIPVESADPWQLELSCFVDCVKEGRNPEQGTGEQARDALLVSLAAQRSLETGQPETV